MELLSLVSFIMTSFGRVDLKKKLVSEICLCLHVLSEVHPRIRCPFYSTVIINDQCSASDEFVLQLQMCW